MKKFKNIQISLLIFSTSVLITIIMTLLLVDFVRYRFLGMNNGYYSFVANDEGNIETTIDSLNEYLDTNNDIVMVIHNYNSNSAYVYDIGLYYDNESIKGDYFEVGDFSNNRKICLVDESSLNYNLIDNNQVYIHGDWYNIIGTIDDKHPLSFNYDSSFRKYEAYPIILPLSSINNIQGHIYLYNLSKLEAKEIANIIVNNQEVSSFEYSSASNMMQALIKHPTFKNIILGFLLSIVILVVTYYMILLNRANEFSIHLLYGANKKELTKILIKDYILLVNAVSFVGCNFAMMINYININYIPMLLIVYTVSMLINGIVLSISFSLFKYNNVLIGGLK